MTAIWLGILAVLKNLVLRVFSEKFFEWALFWALGMLVASTKTTVDNEVYDKVKEVYFAAKKD